MAGHPPAAPLGTRATTTHAQSLSLPPAGLKPAEWGPRHCARTQYLLLQNHCEAAAQELQDRYNYLTSDERVKSIIDKSSMCSPTAYKEDSGPYESGTGNNAGCPMYTGTYSAK